MGRERRELTVVAYVSKHNDPERDPLDESSWEELRDRIEMIVHESRYRDIDAEVF